MVGNRKQAGGALGDSIERRSKDVTELYGNFQARKRLLLRQFDEQYALCREFCDELKNFFSKAIANTPDLRERVQFILARAKDRSSFVKKISRPRKMPYTDIEEVTDLVGVRIITLYDRDIDEVGKLVRTHFKIDEANSVDKRKVHSTAVFGYLSRHFVFSVKKSRSRDVEWSKFAHLKAEIQIRSVAQHAWAEVEHGLGYHAKVSIPEPLRRRFARLAALLEIVDGEFVSLADEVAKYRKKVERPLDDDPVDVESLAGLLDYDASLLKLDRKLAKLGLGLNSNVNRDFAEFLARMTTWAGVQTIGEVRKLFEILDSVIPEYAKIWLTKKRTLDRGISLMYAIYFLVSATSDARGLKEFQSEFGLGRHVSDFVKLLSGSVEDFPEVSDRCSKWWAGRTGRSTSLIGR